MMSIEPLHRVAAILALLIGFCGNVPWLYGQEYSELWGKTGEKWSPQSRLPDFSHAGYHRGEAPIPQVQITANVKDFGAVGDGAHDDTDAFKQAIAQTNEGAILIPEGKYIITDILNIGKSNLVLRGEGAGKSVLFFPKVLNEIKPNWGATTGGQRTSNYSWSGGFIWVRGNFQSQQLAGVTAPAVRGDAVIEVSTTKGISVGQMIEIKLRDTADNTLARHLYSNDPGDMNEIKGRTSASLVCRVTQIEEDRLFLDRPLRFDIRAEWDPTVYQFKPTVTEVGIEQLGFDFPVEEYKGHFTELGYNPIAFSGVADCWIRDIVIRNADSGIFLGGKFCTVQGIVYQSERPPHSSGTTGHHGVYISSDDNLFTDFDFQTRFIHDLTVSHCAGNVFSNGKGIDVCFDHHKRAPYENLFTQIDLGKGSRMWRSGGGNALGRHCGARGTFWNIRADQPQQHPGSFGPASMNLVAVFSDKPALTNLNGVWFEPIDPAKVFPQNLHANQLEIRLARQRQSAVNSDPRY